MAPGCTAECARAVSTVPITSPPSASTIATESGEADRSTVVISHGLWQSQFGGDRNVLGRAVNLNGAPYTIIGVMPPAFYFPNRDVQVWTPLVLRNEDFNDRTNSYLEAVGLPLLALRMRRRRPERYAGLRTLARD